MRTTFRMLAILLLLTSLALAKDSLKKREVEFQGITASISLPSNFKSEATKDPAHSAMFSAPSRTANCMLATLGEKITGAELSSPATLEGIKARVNKREGRILESRMTTLAQRPTLRVVVAVPRSDKMMVQERYLISGDPGWVVMFTTIESGSQELFAESKQWIQTLRFGK